MLKLSNTDLQLNTIRDKLLKHPACDADPQVLGRILVSFSDSIREEELKNRKSGSEVYLYLTPWVEFKTDGVTFHHPDTEESAIALMKSVAQEIMDEYSPRVFSEYVGDEWTDVCNGKIDIMFEFDTYAPR